MIGNQSRLVGFVSVLVLLGAMALACQGELDPFKYTREFVAEAIAMYDAEGPEATFAYYNSQESVDGEWYVYIIGRDYRYLAQPTRPELLGTDIKDSVTPDGQRLGQAIISATEQGRFLDKYDWPNPETGRVEPKYGWVVRHDGLFFGSGWHE